MTVLAGCDLTFLCYLVPCAPGQGTGALCAVSPLQACGAHGRDWKSRQRRGVAAFVPGQPQAGSSAQAVLCCIQKHNEWELGIEERCLTLWPCRSCEPHGKL